MASFKQWRDEIEEEKKKKKEQTPQQVNQQTSQQTASSFNKWRYELENNVPETKPKYNQTESTYKGPDPNEPVENLKDAWGKVTSWAKGLFSGQTNQDINTDKTEDVPTVDIDQVEQRRKEILFAEQQVKNIDDRINQIQTEYILNNANVQNPVKPYSSRNFWGYESLTTELSKEEKGKEFLRTIEKNTVDKKNKELSAEKELLNSASIAYKQYAGQLELNTGVEGAIKDAADLKNFAKTKVPFLSDIFQYLDLWQLKQVSDKYEVGGYDNLSQFEKALLEDYRAKTLLNQIDRGVPYKAANVILDMPKYMLEFVATSGLYSAGSTATKKVVSKVVANEIAQDILGSLVGTELRTIAFAPRIGTQMIEYTLPSYDLVAGEDGTLVMEKIAGGDSYDRAFLKALGSVYTETLVENLGGGLESETFKKGITSMFGKMGTITPEPVKVAAKALIGKVAKINNITTQGELRSLMSKYGNFNGLFSEILEEEVSELLQAPIEERKYYNLATPEGQERFLVETLGIAAFSGFAKIPDAVVNMTRNKDDVIDFPDNIKVVPEDAEKINQEGIKQLAEQEVSMEEPVKEEPIKEEPIKEEVPIQNIVHTETQGDVKLDIQQSADGTKYTIYINGKETDYTYGDLDVAIKAGGGMVKEEQSLIDLSKRTLENKIQGEYTPAEFNKTFDENPVMFKTGDYIVDREGNLKVVVSGNEKYFGDEVNDYLKSINISTLRTSLIGDTSNEGDGYLDYANQVRLATPEEIATIRPEYRVKEQDKPKEVEKEPVRYPTITDTDKSLIMERLKLRYTPDRLSGFFHRMEFGLKPKATQDAGIVRFMAANKELAAMFPKQIEAWKKITGIKEGSKPKVIGEKSVDLFNALKEQVGDIIDMVEPVGDLWNSKGNVIFISQKRERMGFIDALKSNPLVLNAEEGGNNVIKVTIKSDMLSTKKEEKVEKESKEEDEGQKYVWGTVSVDKRLYHGADNIVYEEQKKWQEVLKVNGTQKELLKHMTRDYMPSEIKEEARQILEDWKQMNQWARSDIFIRKYYKDSGVWDAIMYTNQVPGRESIGNEYMDLKTGEFWSENKDYAQLYARQSRHGNREKVKEEKEVKEEVKEEEVKPEADVKRVEEANKYLNEALLEEDKKEYMLSNLPDNLVNSVPLLHTMNRGTWGKIRKLKTYFTWLEMNGYITPEAYRKAEKRINARLEELESVEAEKVDEMRKEKAGMIDLEPEMPTKPKTDKQIQADLVNGHKAVAERKANIPILEKMRVKDGIAQSLNLTDGVYFDRPTSLADGVYTIMGKDAMLTSDDIADFPRLDVEKRKSIARANKDKVSNALKALAPFVGKDDTRPVLTSMYINIDTKNGVMDMIGVDGYRLGKVTIPVEIPDKKASNGIVLMGVPAKIVKVLSTMNNSPLEINIVESKANSNYIEFRNDSGSVAIKGIDGEYPDVKQIFERFEPEYNYEVNRKEFISALKELEPIAKKIIGRKIVLEFNVRGDNLLMRIPNTDTDTVVEKKVNVTIKPIKGTLPSHFEAFEGAFVMPMKIEGVSFEGEPNNIMGVNVSYMVDGLQMFDTNNIELSRGNPMSPLVITTSEDSKYLTKTASKIAKKKLEGRKMDVNAGVSTSANCSVANPNTNSNDIDMFEKTNEVKNKDEKEIFRLSNGIRDLFNWVGEKTRVVEGKDILVRRRSLRVLGNYYPSTNNIGINGMNDFSTAIHEGAHQLDDMRTKSTEKIIQGTEKADKFRKEMTDLYEALYPGGKREHSLRVRMTEGFAVLIENYIKQPTTIKAAYPNLVKEIIMPKGKYYDPLIGEYISRANKVLKEYQNIDELDQMGANLTELQKSNKKSIFSKYTRTQMAVANDLEGFRELAIKQGVLDTASDPYTLGQAYRTSVESVIYSNITGKDGYRIYKDGNFEKVLPYNWRTLIDRLEKNRTVNEFNPWLVARDQHFEYKSLDFAKNFLEQLEDQKEGMVPEDEDWEKINEEIKNWKDFIKEGTKTLRENGFSEEKVARVYEEHKDRFKEEAEMYDNLVDQWIEMQYQARLISAEDAKRLKDKKGYATMRRQFLNEIVGENRLGFTGKTGKPSFMKSRTGGKQAIIYPTDSAIMNEQEGWHKAMAQIINNSIIDMYLEDEMAASGWANRATLVTAVQSDGKITFPQERDPKFVVGRKKNGKRMAIEINAEVRKVLDYVLTPHNYNAVEKMILATTRLFTKGTTVTYPAFAATNFIRDTISNAVNTRTGQKPLIGPLNMLIDTLTRRDPVMLENWDRYVAMGGLDRTFFNMYDMPSKELRKMVTQEEKGIKKLISKVEKGLSILSIPARYSEIANRFPEFDAAKRKGLPDIVAMEYALSVTAPFHHQIADKRFIRTYVASLPFVKAGVEGLSQMAQTVKETPEGRKRFAIVMGVLSAAMVSGLASILMFGSDEQKQLYKDLSPEELGTYVFLPDPDGQRLIKIPVGREMSLLGTTLNMIIAEALLDTNYSPLEIAQALTTWMPIQSPTQLVPQILKPALFTMFNINDYPEIRSLESQTMQYQEPKFRYNQSTSMFAKWLGGILNMDQFSPIKIDYLITGYFGRASGFITGKPRAIESLIDPRIPFIEDSTYFTSGRTLQKYYDVKSNLDLIHGSLTSGRSKFTKEEQQEIRKVYTKVYAVYDEIKNLKEIDIVNNTEDAQEEREKILKLIEEIDMYNLTLPIGETVEGDKVKLRWNSKKGEYVEQN